MNYGFGTNLSIKDHNNALSYSYSDRFMLVGESKVQPTYNFPVWSFLGGPGDDSLRRRKDPENPLVVAEYDSSTEKSYVDTWVNRKFVEFEDRPTNNTKITIGDKEFSWEQVTYDINRLVYWDGSKWGYFVLDSFPRFLDLSGNTDPLGPIDDRAIYDTLTLYFDGDQKVTIYPTGLPIEYNTIVYWYRTSPIGLLEESKLVGTTVGGDGFEINDPSGGFIYHAKAYTNGSANYSESLHSIVLRDMRVCASDIADYGDKIFEVEGNYNYNYTYDESKEAIISLECRNQDMLASCEDIDKAKLKENLPSNLIENKIYSNTSYKVYWKERDLSENFYEFFFCQEDGDIKEHKILLNRKSDRKIYKIQEKTELFVIKDGNYITMERSIHDHPWFEYNVRWDAKKVKFVYASYEDDSIVTVPYSGQEPEENQFGPCPTFNDEIVFDLKATAGQIITFDLSDPSCSSTNLEIFKDAKKTESLESELFRAYDQEYCGFLGCFCDWQIASSEAFVEFGDNNEGEPYTAYYNFTNVNNANGIALDNTSNKRIVSVTDNYFYINGARLGTVYITDSDLPVLFDQSHPSNLNHRIQFKDLADSGSVDFTDFGVPGINGFTIINGFEEVNIRFDKPEYQGFCYYGGGTVGTGYIGDLYGSGWKTDLPLEYANIAPNEPGLPWVAGNENIYDTYHNRLPDESWANMRLNKPKILSGNMGPHLASDIEMSGWETARTSNAQPAIYIDGAAFNGPTPFISYNIQNRDSFGKMLNPYIEITLTGKISPYTIPTNNFNTQVTFDNILGQHQDIYNQCYNASNMAIVVNGQAHIKFGDVFCKSVSFEEGTWTDYSNFRAEFTASFASGDYTSLTNRPNWLLASGMIDDYDISSSITPMDEYSYSSRRATTRLENFNNAQSPGVYQETQRAKISFKPHVREKWETYRSMTDEEQKTKSRQRLLFREVEKLVQKANSQYTGPLYSGVLQFSPNAWRYNKKSTLNYNHSLGVYEWERTSIIAPTGAEYLTNISVGVEATNTDNNMKVTVQGSILGLSVWTEQELYNNVGSNSVFQPPSSGLPITNARDGLAFYTDNYEYGMNSWVYKKASEQTAYLLNPSPETVSISENPTKGSIDFSITYGMKPARYFAGSVSENITVNDTLAGDMFNLVQVMGRANGPMIQDLHSRTEFKRELNIEVILHSAALPFNTSSVNSYEDNKGAFRNSKPTLGTAFRKELGRLLGIYSPAGEPGIVKYYQMPPVESWSPLDGRYNCRVTWVYELGS